MIGVSDPVKAAVVQNLLGTLPTKRKAPVIGECDMCGVIFNSKDQEAMHMNGKKHAKKMKMSAGGGECKEITPIPSLFDKETSYFRQLFIGTKIDLMVI